MALKQNWLQEGKARLALSTPWFFRILIKAGVVCTAIGTGLLALQAVPHIVLPVWIGKIASHLLVAGVIMAGVSKFTTTTPQNLPNSQPNPIPKDVEVDDQKH